MGSRGRVAGVVALVAVLATGCGGDATSDAGATTAPPAPSTAAASTTTTAAEDAPRRATVIAHRGASAYAPEHTFAAYDLALEQGADHIEQDLQMTSDGELVVLHDDTLDRTARGPAESCTGPVATKTLAQLRQCEVGSWFNEAFPDQADPAYADLTIPTLREVLERYGPDVRYYIETKAPEAQPGIEEALLAVLDEVDLLEAAAEDRQVFVQSFSAASLELIHAQAPDLPLVLLLVVSADPIPDAVLDGAADHAVGIGPSADNTDAALVTAAHERCLVVHPYTVDDPGEMSTLLEIGVDGMFTNAPDVLVAQRATAPAPPQHCG